METYHSDFDIDWIPSMMNERIEIIVGIDPDSKKSGLAILKMVDKSVQVKALPFAELMKELQWIKRTCDGNNTPYMVVIENSWDIKGNFHISPRTSPFKASTIGMSIGRCQASGKMIYEMCKFLGIDVKAIHPLEKHWGETGKEKISQVEIERFMGKLRAKDKNGRTCTPNPDMRDAALLAWHEAGLPIIWTPIKKKKKK